MPWEIELSRRATRDLDALSAADSAAVRAALRRLRDEPGAGDLKKLGGRADEWRLRVGRWRVILSLDNRSGVMLVVRVLPRDRAYRD
jgi:mRNA interferase RelE/StbE